MGDIVQRNNHELVISCICGGWRWGNETTTSEYKERKLKRDLLISLSQIYYNMDDATHITATVSSCMKPFMLLSTAARFNCPVKEMRERGRREGGEGGKVEEGQALSNPPFFYPRSPLLLSCHGLSSQPYPPQQSQSHWSHPAPSWSCVWTTSPPPPFSFAHLQGQGREGDWWCLHMYRPPPPCRQTCCEG